MAAMPAKPDTWPAFCAVMPPSAKTGSGTARAIRRARAEAKNNRNLAAQKLGISRTTLWRRLREIDAKVDASV